MGLTCPRKDTIKGVYTLIITRKLIVDQKTDSLLLEFFFVTAIKANVRNFENTIYIGRKIKRKSVYS